MIIQFGSVPTKISMYHRSFDDSYVAVENGGKEITNHYGYSRQEGSIGKGKSSYTNTASDFTYCRKLGGSDIFFNKSTHDNKRGPRISFDDSDILVFGFLNYWRYYYHNYGSTFDILKQLDPLPDITATAGSANNSKYISIGGTTVTSEIVFPTSQLYTFEVEFNMLTDTISLYLNDTFIGSKENAGISGLTGNLASSHAYSNFGGTSGTGNNGVSNYVSDNRGPAPFNSRLKTWDVVELRPISSTNTNNFWDKTDVSLESSVIAFPDNTVVDETNYISTDIIDAECTLTYESIPAKYAVGAVIVNSGGRCDSGGAVLDQTLYVNGTERDNTSVLVQPGSPYGQAHISGSFNNTEAEPLETITDISVKLKHPTQIVL